jgi:hypothetical protein
MTSNGIDAAATLFGRPPFLRQDQIQEAFNDISRSPNFSASWATSLTHRLGYVLKCSVSAG